jgi:ribonuclease HI
MAPKKTKYYAVRKGRKTGIFLTWDECFEQVNGFPGALHKSFSSQSEAEEYVLAVSASTPVQSSPKRPLQSASVLKAKRPSLVKVEPVKIEPGLGRAGVSQGSADDVYTIEYDGAAKGNPGPAGAGALVRHPDGTVVCELREGLGSATNNVAEYRAMLLGLKGALERGIYRVRVQGDSKLVCEQILGRWKVKDETLAIYVDEAKKLVQNFQEFTIRQEFNSAADQLANEAVLLPETKFVRYFGEDCEGVVKMEGASTAMS